MEDIHAAGTSTSKNMDCEVNNNNNNNNNNTGASDSWIKKYLGYDYKKLQSIVSSWGLPANLKRKQLLAIIVAKKKRKDYMIPAILNEVDRERIEKRKYFKQIHERKVHKYYYKPRSALPLIQNLNPPDLHIPNVYANNNNTAAYKNINNEQQNNAYQDRSKSILYANLSSDPRNRFTYKTVHPKIKEITTNSTFKYLDIIPSSPLVLNVVQFYHKPISTAQEHLSSYTAVYIDPPFSSLNFNFGQPQTNHVENDSIISAHLDSNTSDLSLDAILDYVMGEDSVDSIQSSNSLETLINDEAQLDNELAWKIYDMQLCYHAQITAKLRSVIHPLWSTPFCLKRFNNSKSCIFSIAKIQCDALPLFSRALRAEPHIYEYPTNYRQKNCIFPNMYNMHQIQKYNAMGRVPERCLLQPENNLCFGVPRLYFNARDGTNPGISMNNYMIQPNNQADLITKYAYTTPQIHYNIMLPKNQTIDLTVPSSKYIDTNANMSQQNFVELKPRTKTQAELDVEATIPRLSVAEEMLAYNSLSDISSIDIGINESFRYISQAEHEHKCIRTKLPCPFLFTQCFWFENLPSMAQHIRTMHSERIVSKKDAEYFINFIQLESIKNGVKIIQEYNNRMFHISLCYYNSYIFITPQEMCESAEQHGEKLKILLLVKHQSGVRTWKGDVNAMHIPLSHLWRAEHALIIPVQYLKTFPTKHFRLFVQLGI